ncbi:MAG: biotin transporter BioY [Oscillospiraceae bacterium]|nr:biotin transporter BioY [Oscillospiraceae bacterium]
MAVLSQLSIPMPTGVPITLQTFTAALCGYFLGSGYGALAMGVYLLMGLAGAPVFSNFRGGAGILIGPTGGFLFTFPAVAALCGAKEKPAFALPLGILGTLLCHVCGAAYFAAVTKTAFKAAMLTVSLPYLPKDIILTVAAYFLARAIKKAMKIPISKAHKR